MTVPLTPQATTSLTLLEKLGAQDRGERNIAWNRFAYLYTTMLMQWAKRQGFQDSDALDLVQEALLKLMDQLPSYERREGCTFRGWMMAVLRNLGHDFRRRKSTRAISGGDLTECVVEDDLGEIEAREYRQWVMHRGLQMIRDDFSERTWKAFEGVVIQSLPAAKVAEELGVSENVVYLARHRVLARLRSELADLVDTE